MARPQFRFDYNFILSICIAESAHFVSDGSYISTDRPASDQRRKIRSPNYFHSPTSCYFSLHGGDDIVGFRGWFFHFFLQHVHFAKLCTPFAPNSRFHYFGVGDSFLLLDGVI